ncbi:hypothetical protein PDK35_19595 [Bacillus cereus group sp. TH153LC]|nr:hypothetical protein [Bacillus cereus group sp. TH153LC]
MAEDNYRNIHELGGNRTNFIPFRTIKGYISNMSITSSFINIMGNIIPFIPLGFFIPTTFPLKKHL